MEQVSSWLRSAVLANPRKVKPEDIFFQHELVAIQLFTNISFDLGWNMVVLRMLHPLLVDWRSWMLWRADKLCGVTFQPLGARREASCFGLICKLLDEVCVQPLLDITLCPQFQLE